MKTLNFWRTLLFTVTAAAAFAACSDKGEDNGPSGGVPKITVNGGKTTSVGVNEAGATATTAVAVESTGTWTVTTNDAWCIPSMKEGPAGKSNLTFAVAAHATDREATVTLTTYGKIAGLDQQVPATATIVVKQNKTGSTDVKTNVAEIRNVIKGIATQEGAEITSDLTLTAIVISDVVAGGTGGNKSCYVVDNTTAAGAGLIVRFTNAYTYKVGDVITGSIKGGKAALYFGVLQVTPASDGDFSAVSGVSEKVEPALVAVADLANYESQLVKVIDAQPVTAARGGFFYSGTASYMTTGFETKTGGMFDASVYKTNDWAKTAAVPSKSGSIVGVVTVLNGKGQVAPRNAADVAGLTEGLFEVAQLPSITAPSSSAFPVAGATQTIAFTASNLGNNKVFAKVTGTDVASFPVTAGEKTSPISITVAANTGVAKSATLRIYAAATEGGAEVAGVNVVLSQAAPGGGGEKTTTIVMKEYAPFTAVAEGNVIAGTVTVAPFTLAFAKATGGNDPKYYGNAGFESVRMYAANTLTVSGATITKMEFTFAAPYQGANYNNLLTTTGAITTDSDTAQTWMGSASSIVFNINPDKVDGKNLQARIVSVKITYTE